MIISKYSYRKSEIKKSRKLHSEQYPYWYMDVAILSEVFKASKDDITEINVLEEKNYEFQKWIEHMIDKINSFY